MIAFSEIRAQAWRIASAALGVLAVALLVYCLFLQARAARADVRADAASARAEASEARAKALSDALARDAVADGFTATAIQNMDANADVTNARLAALEGKLNGRPPVPAVCPSPDADLLRESQEGSDRFRASNRGLRSLRSPEGAAAH